MKKSLLSILYVLSVAHAHNPQPFEPDAWFNGSADDENAAHQTLRALQTLQNTENTPHNPTPSTRQKPTNTPSNQKEMEARKEREKQRERETKLAELMQAKESHTKSAEQAEEHLIGNIIGVTVSTVGLVGAGIKHCIENTLLENPLFAAGTIIVGLCALSQVYNGKQNYNTMHNHQARAQEITDQIESLKKEKI